MIETYKNYKIVIRQDEDPENPREWDNVAVMVCCHGRYTLGDLQRPDRASMDELEEMQKALGSYILPLYLYDHSGLTIATSPFHCPWDSGRIGFVYITREKMKDEWNITRLTTKAKIKLSKWIDGEIENYNNYLHGNVYGYEIFDKKGNLVDWLWGMYPDHGETDESALREAKAYVDSLPKPDEYYALKNVIYKNDQCLVRIEPEHSGKLNTLTSEEECEKLAARFAEFLTTGKDLES